jgi:hypothetical protein
MSPNHLLNNLAILRPGGGEPTFWVEMITYVVETERPHTFVGMKYEHDVKSQEKISFGTNSTLAARDLDLLNTYYHLPF